MTLELGSALMTLLSLEADFNQKQSRDIMQRLWNSFDHQVKIDLANQDKLKEQQDVHGL